MNLLSERLQEKVELTARPDVPGLPDEGEVFRELQRIYHSFKSEDLFNRAVQAQAMRQR